jgi:hypothetical protein
MDPLSFIAQVLEKTLVLLAGFALGAVGIYVAYEAGIEPVAL